MAQYHERPHAPALFVRHIVPTGLAVGTLVLVHGLMLHSEYYLPFAVSSAARGFDVWLPDLRGHGRSGGTRGHLQDYGEHITDILDVVREAGHQSPFPLWLAGEGYGGLLVYLAAGEAAPALRGLVLAAPLFSSRPTSIPGQPHRWLGGAGSWVKMRWADVAADSGQRMLAVRDTLLCRRYSPGFLKALVKAQGAAMHAPPATIPLLMVLGGMDGITDNRISCSVFEASAPPHALVVYPHAWHALLCAETENIATEVTRFGSEISGRMEPAGII